MNRNTLIVFAHGAPESSRVNQHLLSLAATLPGVRIHDISTRYPDFRIVVEHELTLLAECDDLILQFPLYWYSMPAILKAWLDAVCAAPSVIKRQGLLHGKRIKAATTAGSDLHRLPNSAQEIRQSLFWPIEQTARYLGMEWRPPKIFNDVSRWSETQLANEAQEYQDWLLTSTNEIYYGT